MSQRSFVTIAGEWSTLTLHGTLPNVPYELFSKTDLNEPVWTPRQIVTATGDPTTFSDVFRESPMMFFEAAQGPVPPTTVLIQAGGDYAVEPNLDNGDPGQSSYFTVSRTGSTAAALPVRYYVGGTAANGVDYVALSGMVTIPAGANDASIVLQPLGDYLLEENLLGEQEDVTLSLVLADGYLIDPSYHTATLHIQDNVFTKVLNLSSVVGIDYHPPTQSLLVSASTLSAPNFYRVYPQGGATLSTPWTTIENLTDDEIKLATVKTTANGFIAGMMYFGTGAAGVIGRTSADGTVVNLNWTTLSGVTEHVRGSLYVDQTGVFGGDLIVVPSDSIATPETTKTVWRVHADGTSQSVASFSASHLEGVITLPNDSLPNGHAKWGPWAGRIITGDEYESKIYAIAADGVVTSSAQLGIAPEDFDIIPPGQDLYCAVPFGRILKLSKAFLTEYVGDLLVTQAGEFEFSVAKLFIVRWDDADNTFVVRKAVTILYSGQSSVEHVTFGPIDLPPLTWDQ